MTVFATVGFGDITPVTQLARVLVTIQMLVGLLTVGVIAKVVFGAVQVAESRQTQARRRRAVDEEPDSPGRPRDGSRQSRGVGTPVALPGVRAGGGRLLEAARERDRPARRRVDVDEQRLDQQRQRDRQQGPERTEQPRPEDQGEERRSSIPRPTESPTKYGWMIDWMTKLSTQYTAMTSSMSGTPPVSRPSSAGGTSPMMKPTFGM